MLDQYRTATVVALDDRARPALHGDGAAFLAVPVGYDCGIVGAVGKADDVPSLGEAHGLGKVKAATGCRDVVGHGRGTMQQAMERAQQ